MERKTKDTFVVGNGLLITVFAVMTILALLLVGCGGGSNTLSSSSDEASSSDKVEEQGQNAPLTVKDSVDQYTWGELSQISEEIAASKDEKAAIKIAKSYGLTTSSGKLDGTQEKTLELNDGTLASVQIAGFYHDNKTDGGKAGITFIFKDCIAEHEMNADDTNSGGWEASNMRSWLSTDGLDMLPEDLRSRIVAVDKLTNNTGQTKTSSSVTSTSDKLWLYSMTELCGNIDWFEGINGPAFNSVLNAEGTEYKLFRDSNVVSINTNIILTKTSTDIRSSWWGRSPEPTYSDFFFCVGGGGAPKNSSISMSMCGVVPGFCI